MVQLTAIIVREIPRKHKYRWHVTTDKRSHALVLPVSLKPSTFRLLESASRLLCSQSACYSVLGTGINASV